jgi:hypothetical protein
MRDIYMSRPQKLLRTTMCADWDEVRTYGDKVRRAAALIYAHFRKELLGA